MNDEDVVTIWVSIVSLRTKEGKKKSSGCDAGFLVWYPNEQFLLEPPSLRLRHKLFPYCRICKKEYVLCLSHNTIFSNNGNIIGRPIGHPILSGREG